MAGRGAWGSGYRQQGQGRGQQSQGGGGRGGWGSGFRGAQPDQQQGRGRSDNRFQQLSQQEDNDAAFDRYKAGGRGGGGGRGRGRQGHGGSQPSWREAVQFDDENERPGWQLTSYGHEREGATDLTGDTSFEELRWRELQAARSGTPAAQIQQQYIAAVRAKQQQWEALLKAQRPPSQGGPAIPVPDAASGSGCVGTAGPFQRLGGPFQQQQQPAPAFGQPQLLTAFESQPAAAPKIAFGQAAQPVAGGFGAAATGAQPFGASAGQSPFGAAPAASGFGGNAGAGSLAMGTASVGGGFGSVAGSTGQSPFGQPTTVAATGFGHSVGALNGHPNPFGFGGSGTQQQEPVGGVSSVFGGTPGAAGGQAASPPIGAFGQSGPLFGQSHQGAPLLQPASSPATAGGAVAAQPQANGDLAVWQAPAFEKGKVPEQPPPPEVCV